MVKTLPFHGSNWSSSLHAITNLIEMEEKEYIYITLESGNQIRVPVNPPELPIIFNNEKEYLQEQISETTE